MKIKKLLWIIWYICWYPFVRFIILLARIFGTNAVHDLVIGLEGEEERIYASRPPSTMIVVPVM